MTRLLPESRLRPPVADGAAFHHPRCSGRNIAALSAAVLLAAAATSHAPPARAAEGGIGFYLLGQRGNLAAVVPPPGLYLQVDTYLFAGHQAVTVPQGGRIDAELDVDAALPLVTGIWVPESPAGASVRPFFGATVVSGYKDISLEAQLTAPGGNVLRGERSADDFLFGDPVLTAGLGGGSGPWFWSGAVAVNVPVGDYERGRATNVSFNRWAADLTGSVTWLDQDSGWEASVAAGVTMNWENDATDYDTGTEVHVEAGVSKTLASGWSLGLNGYHYQQVTADDGASALLGDFKGRVSAVGPSAAYTLTVGETPVTLKARYFHEFNARNRVPGDILFLSLVAPISF